MDGPVQLQRRRPAAAARQHSERGLQKMKKRAAENDAQIGPARFESFPLVVARLSVTRDFHLSTVWPLRNGEILALAGAPEAVQTRHRASAHLSWSLSSCDVLHACKGLKGERMAPGRLASHLRGGGDTDLSPCLSHTSAERLLAGALLF